MKQWDYVSRLIRFAFRENPLLYLGIAVSLFSVAVELLAMVSLFPLLQILSTGEVSGEGLIVRGLNLMGVEATARSLLWTFIGLLSLRIVTQLGGETLSLYLGKRVLAQLGSRAFEQIVHNLSIQEINDKSIGFYIGLAGDESFRASTLVISSIQFVSTAALALLYFLAIAKASPIAALLVLIFIVIAALSLIWVMRKLQQLGSRKTEESRNSHSVFLDSLNNLKTVRTFSAETYVAGIYRDIIFGYTRILFRIDALALSAKLVPVLLLLGICSIWFVFNSQLAESIGLAFIVTMIVYLMRFLPVMGDAAQLLFRVVSDARSGQDVTAILERPTNSEVGSPALSGVKSIELRNVGFYYGEADGRTVLAGVNVDLRNGKSYALTGRSGIGKSTLVDLLLKFYLPTAGTLSLSGLNIAAISSSQIRRKVLLISQESAIFDDTVANNIRMGFPSTIDEVAEACELACVSEVIDAMPDGYETRLQYQGRNLSGGQRQRIAIARGLLRRPDVLILDESTSALDKVTQTQVVENILREFADKIVIFITHDPSIMNRVDVVIDMQSVNQAVKTCEDEFEASRNTVSPQTTASLSRS